MSLRGYRGNNTQPHKYFRLLGIGLVVLGLLVLVGWAFDVDAFKSILPGLATMKANTALGLLLVGLAFIFFRNISSAQPLVMLLGLLVLLLGTLSLSQYLFSWDLGVDELLFLDPDTASDRFPGRMSPATATTFIGLGWALLILGSGHLFKFAQILAFVVLILSGFTLMGYFYGIEATYRVFFFNSIALHTASAQFLAALAIFFAYPERLLLTSDTGPAGQISRRVVPIVIFVPLAIGWLIVNAERWGWIDSVILTELTIGLTVAVLLLLTWQGAHLLRRADHARSVVEADLLKANRAYRTLSACNQTLIRAKDEDDLMEQICDNIVHIGGYPLAHIVIDGDLTRLCVQDDLADLPPLAKLRQLAELTLTSGQPQIFSDLHNQESWKENVPGLASLVALPIRDNGTLYGSLHVFSHDIVFSDAEIALMTELAGDLAFGLMTLRARAAHRASEEHIHYQANLLENISDAVIGTDLEFKVTSWNKAAERIYGWTEAEVLGKALGNLLKTEIIGDEVENSRRLLREFKNWRGEAIQTCRDGSRIHVLASVTFVYTADGDVMGVVGVNRDMTEVKAASAAAQSSEKRFRALFDEAQDIVLIIDGSDGRILNVNPALRRVLGYDQKAIVGKSFSTLFSRPIDELMERIQKFGAVFAAQHFQHQDGRIMPMDLTATLIPGEDNDNILITLRDVSERERLTRELFDAELARLTLEQEHEMIKLREEFMSTVAHDFRNPLGVILTSSDMLLHYRDRIPPEKQLEHIERIHSHAVVMRQLMQAVLDFVRNRSDKLNLKPEPLDLVALGKEIFERAQMFEEARSQHNEDAEPLTFTYVTRGELDNAWMDSQIIQRVLTNLLVNAIKYSPNGGEVRFEIAREGQTVVFTVRDQGIGIPADDLPHIFKPFKRASNTRRIEGTGLGMAIVKDNIDYHGGSVDIESELGEGTTITVRVPYQTHARTPASV